MPTLEEMKKELDAFNQLPVYSMSVDEEHLLELCNAYAAELEAAQEDGVTYGEADVERVAKAICREWHSTNVKKQHTDWCVEKFWERCIPEAKAAIEALSLTRKKDRV